VVTALQEGTDMIRPVRKPQTIALSLASFELLAGAAS
jgi:hypothetical protein